MRKLYTVIIKEWFDRTYGNSYNAVRITDNRTGRLIAALPFAYGYGDYGQQRATKWLKANRPTLKMDYLRERAIIHKIEDCRQREVKEWGVK